MTKTDLICRDMLHPGKASFFVWGQFGSVAKGCAAAWLAHQLSERGQQYDILASVAGCQSGHTAIHKGNRRVSFHLPSSPFVFNDEGGYKGVVYLTAGSVIDPHLLLKEIKEYNGEVLIHPNAAIIDADCVAAENKPDSSQTKIASTRKGVGEAISRKVRRAGVLARDCKELKRYVRRLNLNKEMGQGKSVLVEIPQGVSLGIDTDFHPNVTSRNCTPAQAASDAGIHPYFYGACMVVLRCFPIRVGNIVDNGVEIGNSGACYSDQHELSWEDLGVEAEITTVTKRIRRVFTFSRQQIVDTFSLCRPDACFLSFTNYVKSQSYLDEILHSIYTASQEVGCPPPRVVFEHGPTTADVGEEYNVTSRSPGQSVARIEDSHREARSVSL